jgi:predicted O-methyltransferase YrrM
MEGIPADYEVDGRGHVHHGAALTVLTGLDANASDFAFCDGFAPTPQLIDGLHRRVRTGGVLVCANLHNSRNQGTPECCQPWQPVSGAGPA